MKKIILIVLLCIPFISCSNKNDLDLSQSEFVFIKPGTYKIGSPVGERDRWPKGQEDIRNVKTNGFYMSKTEITEEQYYSVVDPDHPVDTSANLPVVNITWIEALQYCNLRSSKEGLSEVYVIPAKDEITLNDITVNENANGYRLPTIDEWEIACRAGTRTTYYTGRKITHKQANFDSDGRMPVASFPPNKFGLYDMSGNVDEWCYRDEYFILVKGGSWKNNVYSIRSSSIWFARISEKNDYTGFRIIKYDF